MTLQEKIDVAQAKAREEFYAKEGKETVTVKKAYRKTQQRDRKPCPICGTYCFGDCRN